MAITQDRMLALIRAARDFQQAGQAARRVVTKEFALYKAGTVSAETALNSIFDLAVPEYKMMNDKESTLTLGVEEYHFKKFASQNNSARRRQERQRKGELPEKPSILAARSPTTAPKALAVRTGNDYADESHLSERTKQEIQEISDKVFNITPPDHKSAKLENLAPPGTYQPNQKHSLKTPKHNEDLTPEQFEDYKSEDKHLDGKLEF